MLMSTRKLSGASHLVCFLLLIFSKLASGCIGLKKNSPILERLILDKGMNVTNMLLDDLSGEAQTQEIKFQKENISKMSGIIAHALGALSIVWIGISFFLSQQIDDDIYNNATIDGLVESKDSLQSIENNKTNNNTTCIATEIKLNGSMSSLETIDVQPISDHSVSRIVRRTLGRYMVAIGPLWLALVVTKRILYALVDSRVDGQEAFLFGENIHDYASKLDQHFDNIPHELGIYEERWVVGPSSELESESNQG